MPASTRDKTATWRSLGTLCRKRDWSKPRALYELQNGLRYRTIPPWHEKIDWYDPIMQHRLNVEASEMTMMGLDFVTLGIEVLDEPADTEGPPPSVDVPGTVPAPLRVSLTSKDIRDCILAIQKERPNDPPGVLRTRPADGGHVGGGYARQGCGLGLSQATQDNVPSHQLVRQQRTEDPF